VLSEANAELAQMGLDPISATDLDDPESREIFRVWRELVDRGITPSLEQLAQVVPTELHARLDALLDTSSSALHNRKWLVDAHTEPGQDVFELRPDRLRQDLLNGLLRLRERNLKRRNAEIRFLLEDADQADARLYQQAINATSAALLRLQQRIISGPASEQQTLNSLTDWEKVI
jgi:hypothetical protein